MLTLNGPERQHPDCPRPNMQNGQEDEVELDELTLKAGDITGIIAGKVDGVPSGDDW